jgi:capsular polysaccharide biosynthesis protein/Mrp family chromosome partitioning ATPase
LLITVDAPGLEEGNMDLRMYLRLFFRWSWLIALCTVAGVVLSFAILSSTGLLSSYSATATVAIGAQALSSDQDPSYLNTAASLAPTYVELAKLEPVTQGVIDALDLPETTAELSQLLEVSQILDTQLIEIKATYQDPETAADIANEVARQLALLAPSHLRNFIVTVQPARAPMRSGLTASLAPPLIVGALGFLLSTGAVFLFDFLRDAIHDAEDVAQRLGLTTLAVVRMPGWSRSGRWGRWQANRFKPETHSMWWSLMEACWRRHVEAIEQAPGGSSDGHDDERETLLVLITSSSRDDGQSAAALNLAGTWAHSGRTVLLVDAYTAHPRLHTSLGLADAPGLTDLLGEPGHSLEEVIRPIEGVPGLSVLPVGSVAGQSLSATAPAVRQALEAMRGLAQVIVVAGPPVLAGADAVMLASQASGGLLVLRADRTRTEKAAEAVDLLNMAGGSLWGAVLNRG